jgi:hypothetical protein
MRVEARIQEPPQHLAPSHMQCLSHRIHPHAADMPGGATIG